MSKKLYEELFISGIANAIREKLGVSNTYKVVVFLTHTYRWIAVL